MSADKVELAVHLKKFEAYKKEKRKWIEASKVRDDVLVIEFDYGQNLPLPKLNVNEQFYKRLLWYFVFNVHLHNDDSSTFYTFTEDEGKKGADSVCSFIYSFLVQAKKKFPNVTQLVFLSDACGGQNKNRTVINFSLWLSKEWGVDVLHLFPVRGHSYNQCDRNFGLYGTKIRKLARIEWRKRYVSILQNARSNPSPFKVVAAKSLMKAWEESLSPYFKKHAMSKGKRFTLQKYSVLKYSKSSPGVIEGSSSYFPIYDSFSLCKKGVALPSKSELNLQAAPPGKMKVAKLNDVADLVKYLSPRPKEWLENLLREARNNTADEASSDSDELE